jgi:hypothetical protein
MEAFGDCFRRREPRVWLVSPGSTLGAACLYFWASQTKDLGGGEEEGVRERKLKPGRVLKGRMKIGEARTGPPLVNLEEDEEGLLAVGSDLLEEIRRHVISQVLEEGHVELKEGVELVQRPADLVPLLQELRLALLD